MDWMSYKVDAATEQEWLEKEPKKSLADAAILVPEGKTLSDEAIETIRHIRYYLEGQNGFVLLADRVVVCVELGSVEELLEQAQQAVDDALGSMPDFCPYNMDDDCCMLHLSNSGVYGFRDYMISVTELASLLEVRQECLEACERNEIIAVVLC